MTTKLIDLAGLDSDITSAGVHDENLRLAFSVLAKHVNAALACILKPTSADKPAPQRIALAHRLDQLEEIASLVREVECGHAESFPGEPGDPGVPCSKLRLVLGLPAHLAFDAAMPREVRLAEQGRLAATNHEPLNTIADRLNDLVHSVCELTGLVGVRTLHVTAELGLRLGAPPGSTLRVLTSCGVVGIVVDPRS